MNQNLGFATFLTCPVNIFGLGKTFICSLICYIVCKVNMTRAETQSTPVLGELLLSVNAQLYLHGWHSWEMTCGMKLKLHQRLQSKTVTQP